MITSLKEQLAKEKETTTKKANMVRQMYQHETKLKAQVKELEQKLAKDLLKQTESVDAASGADL